MCSKCAHAHEPVDVFRRFTSSHDGSQRNCEVVTRRRRYIQRFKTRSASNRQSIRAHVHSGRAWSRPRPLATRLPPEQRIPRTEPTLPPRQRRLFPNARLGCFGSRRGQKRIASFGLAASKTFRFDPLFNRVKEHLFNAVSLRHVTGTLGFPKDPDFSPHFHQTTTAEHEQNQAADQVQEPGIGNRPRDYQGFLAPPQKIVHRHVQESYEHRFLVFVVVVQRRHGNPDSSSNVTHCRGTTVAGDAFTAEEAMHLGHLGGWDVRKVPLSASILGDDGVTTIDAPGFATVRSNPFTSEPEALGVVGAAYQPLQNEAHTEFLNTLADVSGATFETAGSLRGGRHVFITMKLPRDIRAAGTDRINLNIATLNSHGGSSAFRPGLPRPSGLRQHASHRTPVGRLVGLDPTHQRGRGRCPAGPGNSWPDVRLRRCVRGRATHSNRNELGAIRPTHHLDVRTRARRRRDQPHRRGIPPTHRPPALAIRRRRHSTVYPWHRMGRLSSRCRVCRPLRADQVTHERRCRPCDLTTYERPADEGQGTRLGRSFQRLTENVFQGLALLPP